MLPQLPTEVWERVIDHLWEDHRELQACSTVCRAWSQRSFFHLLSRVFLHTRADVHRLFKVLNSNVARKEGVHTIIIRGDANETVRLPIPQFAAFAATFANDPPRTEELGLWHAEWQNGTIQDTVFTHLTAFASITKLTLAYVTFPKVLTFGRLICALPRLTTLACRDVAFKDTRHKNPAAFLSQKTNIRDFDMLCGTPMKEVVDFIVGPGDVARWLKKIYVAWWEPAPLLKDLKSLSIKPLLQAAGRSLLSFDIRFGGLDLEPRLATEAIGELDLCRNTNLRELRLTLHVGPPSEEHTPPLAVCTWLSTLLSTIASKDLTFLTLEFDIRDLVPLTSPDQTALSAHDRISMLLSMDECARIEGILAREQFGGLESVYVGVFCSAKGVVVDEADWSAVIGPRFPGLRDRGILHPAVDIDLER